MIVLNEKSHCCGCEACVQACPQGCISFTADEEGFYYPKVNANYCIQCGRCDAVCPVLNQSKATSAESIYALKCDSDDLRLLSSSGGVFSLFAECVIASGGVVFGAKFNNEWSVEHGFTECQNGIEAFRKSKYVQSRIGRTYKEAEKFLKVGKKVLFSGTSCQISGLKQYLGKNYDNLLTIDVICHGVPSPMVWKKYLSELIDNAPKGKNSVSSPLIPLVSESDAYRATTTAIKGINFRDKRTGWKKFSFALTFAKALAEGKQNTVSLSRIHRKDPYMMAFIRNLILRPSCHLCPAKGGKSRADITLGDFWTIKKWNRDFDDDQGVSMVIVNSNKGNEALGEIMSKTRSLKMDNLSCLPVNYYNPSKAHPNRNRFFMRMNTSTGSITELLTKECKPTLSMMPRIYTNMFKSVIIRLLRKYG